MRKQIKFVIGASVGLVWLALATTASAQSLQRPVNAPSTPERSLGDLASQANPGRNVADGTTHVYTNADLKLRPAPVLPTTPSFPEIAPARGILEHPGAPEIEFEFESMPQGVPMWDLTPGGLFAPIPGQGQRQRRGRQPRPGDDLHNRFGIFDPNFGLRSGALGAPMGSGRDLFTVGRGGRSGKGFSGHGGGQGSGKKQ